MERNFSSRHSFPLELRTSDVRNLGKVHGNAAKHLTFGWNRPRRAASQFLVFRACSHSVTMPSIPSNKPYRVGRSRTGLGLFATKPIKKGTKIIRYFGPLLDSKKKEE